MWNSSLICLHFPFHSLMPTVSVISRQLKVASLTYHHIFVDWIVMCGAHDGLITAFQSETFVLILNDDEIF